MSSNDNSESTLGYILGAVLVTVLVGLMVKYDYDRVSEELESCRSGQATWEPVFAERNTQSGELRLVEEIVE